MRPKTDRISPLPPFFFPGKTASERALLTKLKKQRKVHAIGPKLYSSVSSYQVGSLVKNSWAHIVSHLYPKALISHATALTYQPSIQGEIFLTSKTNREIKFPGITLKFMRGHGPIKSDVLFMGMKASSFERALLETLSISKRKQKNRSLPQTEIEKRLEEILISKGENELNELRRRASVIAKQLSMKHEFKKLDNIVGALLSTRPEKYLKSEAGISRARRIPFDTACFGRLENLFSYLRHLPIKDLVEENKSADHFLNKAFFDSYFSNYIEGTIFEIQEAERIVFDKSIPVNRPIDAHDILGTFKIISDPNEMRKLPVNPDQLVEILQKRHFILLEQRRDVNPGKFKSTIYRAGNTQFVHPDYIQGTIQKGFDLYQSLPKGLARSIFMMFLVSDIHPFNDGNGRLSRIMMNAELTAQGLSTIIIPTVYREDYLLSLRALTRRSDPQPFVKMLLQAHSFSNLKFSPFVKIKSYLESHNWFYEPNEAQLIR